MHTVSLRLIELSVKGYYNNILRTASTYRQIAFRSENLDVGNR